MSVNAALHTNDFFFLFLIHKGTRELGTYAIKEVTDNRRSI